MKNSIVCLIIFILITFNYCFSQQISKIKIDTIKGDFLLDFGQNTLAFRNIHDEGSNQQVCGNIETYNKNNVIIFNKDKDYSNNYIYGIFHFVPNNPNVSYIEEVPTTIVNYLWKNDRFYKKYEDIFCKKKLKRLKKITFTFDKKKNKLVSHSKKFGYYFLNCKIVCIKDDEIKYFRFPNFVDGVYKEIYSYENYFILDIIF